MITFILIFLLIVDSLGIIMTIIFYIHSDRFRRKLVTVKNLEELGRLTSAKKNVPIDNALLQKKLQSFLKSKGVLIEINKQVIRLLYIVSAVFMLSLGAWIASVYPDRLSMLTDFFDKETHDASQKLAFFSGLVLLGSIQDYILRRKRIQYYSSIVDKFKELGMEESGT